MIVGSLRACALMPNRPLDPDVADEAPTALVLTGYDDQHLVTYLRPLDADAASADWEEVARLVLHRDPEREPARTRRAWESHLARALDDRTRLPPSAPGRPALLNLYNRPHARYRPLPVASRSPSSATRSCAARGVIRNSSAIMPAETTGRVST